MPPMPRRPDGADGQLVQHARSAMAAQKATREKPTLSAVLAGLSDTHEQHKGDPVSGVPEKPKPPVPDYDADTRAIGTWLAFLVNDSPERVALLQAAGLGPNALTGSFAIWAAAEAFYHQADEEQIEVKGVGSEKEAAQYDRDDRPRS